MTRRLIVHVGPPKTATTSIQHALFENEDALGEMGVYLPSAGRYELAKRGVVHHHLGWELIGNRKFDRSRGGWDELRDELADVDASTVIVTSEILLFAMYEPAHREKLLAALRGLDLDVTLVYTIREPLSRLNSGYAQRVKMLGERLSFEEYVGNGFENGRLYIDERLAPFIEADDIRFVVIDFADLVADWPPAAFFRAVGLDVPLDDLKRSAEPSNVTLGPIGIEAALLLRSHLEVLDAPFDNTRMEARRLNRVAARQCKKIGWCEDRFWGWSHEFAEQTLERLQPSYERFSQSVWGRPWQPAAPLDTPQQRIKLLDLDTEEISKVNHFVNAMSRRYTKLRREGDPRADDVMESDDSDLDVNDDTL